MNKTKVIKIDNDVIYFDNEYMLFSHHEQDCCESHYLEMKNLSLSDFEGLVFDLSNDNFFERIPGFGIALIPINGFPVRIPGYGYNNGYYSSNLSLCLKDRKNKTERSFNISECQDEGDY